MSKNLVELLGERKRDNTEFSMYEDNPVLYDQLGEQGISFVNIPDWYSKYISDNPFTIGNTIFAPGEYKEGGTSLAYEEIPHVTQYREKGFAGFFKDYFSEMAIHGFEDMYKKKGTMESFHFMDPEKKASLIAELVPDSLYQDYVAWDKKEQDFDTYLDSILFDSQKKFDLLWEEYRINENKLPEELKTLEN